jgi:AcrR family transcriptional regulator
MEDIAKKPKKSDRTRAAILAAAQAQFAEQGFERATIRDIARAASIDPSMVMRYFRSKDDLFAAAAVFDLNLPDLTTVPRENIGRTLARHFLGIWEGQGGTGFPILLRSATSNDYAAERMRQIVATQLIPPLMALGAAETAPLRAGLIASQILGLALTRYVLKLPPAVALAPDDIVAHVGDTLQRYIFLER